MSYKSECERAIRRFYEEFPAEISILRSAYADAAHLLDAIAKDIINDNKKGNREPRKEIKTIANEITKAANAVFALRDNLNIATGNNKGDDDE